MDKAYIEAVKLMLRIARDVFEATPFALKDRGRNGTLFCPAPPSEPDLRISRIRLSS
jgi:hypothetical protein